MADESAIRATLVAYAGLTALIGGATPRLWDQLVPVGEPAPVALPYVLMTAISSLPDGGVADAPGIAEVTVQFDIYAQTKASAKAVLAQMRAALHAAGWVDSERNEHDMPTDDPAQRRITSEWDFWIPR